MQEYWLMMYLFHWCRLGNRDASQQLFGSNRWFAEGGGHPSTTIGGNNKGAERCRCYWEKKGIAPDWWWVSTVLFQSKLHGDCYSVILIRISTQLIEIQAASLVQLRIIGKQLLPAIFCWNHHVSDRDFWNNIFLLTSSIRVLINSWNATSTHFINKNIILSYRIMISRLQTK